MGFVRDLMDSTRDHIDFLWVPMDILRNPMKSPKITMAVLRGRVHSHRHTTDALRIPMGILRHPRGPHRSLIDITRNPLIAEGIRWNAEGTRWMPQGIPQAFLYGILLDALRSPMHLRRNFMDVPRNVCMST
eukprot:9494530-Pyramimonas_sp.AAC.1